MITEEQRERWKQGCQAVFAGFVASAHHRGVSHPHKPDSGVSSEADDEAAGHYRYLLAHRTEGDYTSFAPKPAEYQEIDTRRRGEIEAYIVRGVVGG